MSGYIDTYPQTQAQWDADARLFHPNVVAVVTDGANIGRKKWFDGVHTFAELDYVDASDPLSSGQAFGIPMTFSTAVSGAPAEGVFRFDNAVVGDISNVAIHMTAPTGVSNAGQWTLNNPQRGYLKATHAAGDTLFQFNGEGSATDGVYEAPMVWLSGPLPANNAPCRVVYLPGGTSTVEVTVNGTPEALESVIVDGVVNAASRLTVDMSASWTNIRFSNGIAKSDGAGSMPTITYTAANIVRFTFYLDDGSTLPEDTPVQVMLWGY